MSNAKNDTKILPDGRPYADETVPLDLDWGQVELFRWQYGELPKPDDKRTINLVNALGRLGEGVFRGDAGATRNNVAQSLMAAAFLLHERGYQKEANDD